MTCLLATTRCAGEIRDCDPMRPRHWGPPDLPACEEYPGAVLAAECWRQAEIEATWAWVDSRHFPALHAVRSAARSTRDALAYASTETWLREQGMRDCQRA